MASSCNRFISRTTISSIKYAIKSKVQTSSLGGSTFSARVPLSAGKNTAKNPLRRFASLSRSPAELGCVQSLLPLHSAVAVSRLTSCLSLNSRDSRALSQVFHQRCALQRLFKILVLTKLIFEQEQPTRRHSSKYLGDSIDSSD